jgi:hypothetical protein
MLPTSTCNQQLLFCNPAMQNFDLAGLLIDSYCFPALSVQRQLEAAIEEGSRIWF